MPSPLFFILPVIAIVAIATVVITMRAAIQEQPPSGNGNSYRQTSPETDENDGKKLTSSPTKGKKRSPKKKDSDRNDSSTSNTVHRRHHHTMDYNRSQCFICCETEPNIQMITLKPCKHSGICKNCIETLLNESIKCPFCRSPIKSYSRSI